MLHGWLKLHRSLLSHWVASEPESLAVWIRLLSEANHKASKKRFNGSLVDVARGQTIFGLNAFSDKSGVSKAKLRRILNELESDGMISRQITNKYSLITITYFEKYQGDDTQDASKPQASSKQTASKSQHRKNDKNGKNGKEDINPSRFDEFWDLYDKKRSLETCRRKFEKLSGADVDKIFEVLPKYVASTPEKKYRKDPSTWLNQRCWNDEIEGGNDSGHGVKPDWMRCVL